MKGWKACMQGWMESMNGYLNGWLESMNEWLDGLMDWWKKERLEDTCKYSNMDRNMKKVRLDDRCDSFTQSSGFAMFLVTQALKRWRTATKPGPTQSYNPRFNKVPCLYASLQFIHLCCRSRALCAVSVCWVSPGCCWVWPGAVPSAGRESCPEERKSSQYSCVWMESPDTRTKMERKGRKRPCLLLTELQHS